jgi:hypothetical protein
VYAERTLELTLELGASPSRTSILARVTTSSNCTAFVYARHGASRTWPIQSTSCSQTLQLPKPSHDIAKLRDNHFKLLNAALWRKVRSLAMEFARKCFRGEGAALETMEVGWRSRLPSEANSQTKCRSSTPRSAPFALPWPFA